MTTRKSAAGLIAQIRDAGIAIDNDVHGGGLEKTAARLAEIHFETRSPCRDVRVWLRANGHLEEVIIADGALDRRDGEQMAALITETLRRAEVTMHQALQSMFRSQKQTGK